MACTTQPLKAHAPGINLHARFSTPQEPGYVWNGRVLESFLPKCLALNIQCWKIRRSRPSPSMYFSPGKKVWKTIWPAENKPLPSAGLDAFLDRNPQDLTKTSGGLVWTNCLTSPLSAPESWASHSARKSCTDTQIAGCWFWKKKMQLPLIKPATTAELSTQELITSRGR